MPLASLERREVVKQAKVVHIRWIERGGGWWRWVEVVKAYARCGCVAEARRVVEGMGMRMRAVKGKEEEIVVASTAVMTAYAAQGWILAAREVLDGLLAIGIGVDAVSWNAMIAGYAQNAQMEKAAELFGIMPLGKRNVVTWTAMISGYVRSGSAAASSALRLFNEMPVQLPNHVTFAALLPACQHLETLQGIHEQILRRGFQSNLFVCNGLVHMYAKLGAIGVARQVFDKMAERNVVSWTAMVAAYARVDLREALRLFWRMPQPNVVSWNAIIGGCMHHGSIAEALLLFHQMPRRNGVSWNIMIVGYAERGKTEEALKLLEQMPTTDMAVAVVSWNAVIAGFADKGEEEEALRVFRVMQSEREVMMKPNSKTFTLVLPLYGKRAGLKQGKEIHGAIVRAGLGGGRNVYVSSAVVDMYAKSGSIGSARKAFEETGEGERDVVSWSSMIMGYAMHGQGREAVRVFERMQECGRRPDHVTVVGVLWGCAQSGLVEEGWRCFRCIEKPTMEHYGCMVDLLARAGLLHHALHLINTMPIKADATVWASLLGACQTHVNLQLGEYVAHQLFQLDPQNPAPYVQLSNIYAATGSWEATQTVRQIMKVMRFTKKPGSSWIEVNKQIHAFTCL